MHKFVKSTGACLAGGILAVLPEVGRFAQRLTLPIDTPITTNQVAEFRYREDAAGGVGYVRVTNGTEFWFEHGIVNGYRTPRSYYDLQNPKEVPKYFGPVNLSQADAIARARGTLERLGYSLSEVFADQEPRVEGPQPAGTNIISYYRIRWDDPLGRGAPAAIVDLSGIDGSIAKIELVSPVFWRDGAMWQGNADTTTKWSTNIQVDAVDPRVFAQAAALLHRLQPTAGVVIGPQSCSSIQASQGGSRKELVFTNGYRIYVSGSRLAGFRSPDSYFNHGLTERSPIVAYLGKWNLSEESALDLARKALDDPALELPGRPPTSPPTTKLRAPDVGRYIIPRFYFAWTVLDKGSHHHSTFKVEVDATAGQVKYLETATSD
jgi:hypothetical protein